MRWTWLLLEVLQAGSPLSEHGFTLHRSAFQDALALRYGWSPLRPPSLCTCGTAFSVEHALSCPKGGLPSLRHNEIRDLTATLLTEVCSQVCVEPELQPVQHSDEFPLATSNTQDSARLDVAVNGFWQTSQPGNRPGREKASHPFPCSCKTYHLCDGAHAHIFVLTKKMF